MTGFRHPAFACALVLSILLAAPSSIFPVAVGARGATPVGNGTGEGAVLLFAAPGMRPDLIESFATEGALPAMADLLENGAAADDGLLASFPATTGTNLPTLLSGA
jgi:predicted AlkP superfamily pyrophosphatase or phosphodiesterase